VIALPAAPNRFQQCKLSEAEFRPALTLWLRWRSLTLWFLGADDCVDQNCVDLRAGVVAAGHAGLWSVVQGTGMRPPQSRRRVDVS